MTAPKNFPYLLELNKKKLRILDLIVYKGELTEEIKIKVLTTNELSSLEEFYDSYSSNNETRGLRAVKKGLDPLATILWRQEKSVIPQDDALAFIDSTHQINSRDEALAGARDIVAEWIRNNKEAKKELRTLLKSHGLLNMEIIKEDHPELSSYKKYLNGPILPITIKANRIFKILEAESKGILSLSISIPQEECLRILEKFFIKKDSATCRQVRIALEDSYQRFLLPYLEMEIRTQLLEDAFQEILGQKKKLKYLFSIPVLLALFIFLPRPQPTPDGVQKKYYREGVLKSEETYKDGKLNGIVKKYYSSGEVMSIEGYLNGKRDGGFRKFLPNSQIILFVTYKNGILDGESREYYDNGEWRITKNYQDGLLEGPLKKYDQQGRLQYQIYYHKNIPIQETKHE